MAYIPNPTDATQPTGSVDASTADDEFRALKAYVLGLALTAGMFTPVRQTVNDGFVNATGDPAFMIAAVAGGLALDLKAAGRPLVANFAGGNTGTGTNDRNSTLTADTAGIVAGLAPSNTNYIYADYVSAAAMTWGQTLAPVQYGKVYPQTIGSVLQFAGAAGSTVFLDDFGNTWTAQGGAKVQTNQFKFGTGGLGGGGALNKLDGATDYIKTTVSTTIVPDGWAIRAWVNPSVLPIAASGQTICMFSTTAATSGARLHIFNNAGTIRFSYSLSSDSATFNIVNNAQGTTLPVVGTWYFVELTYDALAGIYRLYVNGAQEQSTVSALRVPVFTVRSAGATTDGSGGFFNGYIDKPEFLSYCQHPAGTAYAVPTGAASLATPGYAPDAFDIQAMKMYQVTGPSAAAGAPPATTQKYRVYLGETDTNAAIPTAVRNYAFNGRFTSAVQAAAAGAAVLGFTHLLGLLPGRYQIFMQCLVTDAAGYAPGDEVVIATQDNATNVLDSFRNKTTLILAQSSQPVFAHRTTGARTGITATGWRVGAIAERGWGGA